MIHAIISDIHGNLEAFKSVLEDIRAQGANDVHCLGDAIGYGPRPNECLDLIRERAIPMIMGNHEFGLARTEGMAFFNPQSRENLRATGKLISPANLDFIKSLPIFMVLDEALLVHGYPPDEISTYLFMKEQQDLANDMPALKHRLNFVGHTHELECVSLNQGIVSRSTLNKGTITMDPRTKYIINAGSVGQPRDGNNNAKYLLWDTAENTVEVRYVPYDIETTVREIKELGFNSFYASRLW